MSSPCFLLLGSNLGNREENMDFAMQQLASHPLNSSFKQSSIYATKPWGLLEQPDFLNRVVYFYTKMSLTELFGLTQSIEVLAGRVKGAKWGPRILDIDVLYFDNQVLSSKDLVVPHAGIPNRRFCLIPLVEIAPNFIHPLLKKTHRELLENCEDLGEVKIYNA
jgi:2-amino-4-hydroxy-6-hydroxymethyldihydropteridine diphosphokinase